MNLITSEFVLGIVGPLWPVLSGDSRAVDIELSPRAPSSPVRAMIGYQAEAERWHVLADEALTPRELCWILHHEAAHVRAGDVTQDAAITELDRRMFRGDGTAGAAMRRHAWIASRDAPASRHEESQADEWANETARQTWAMLEAIEEAAIAAIGQTMRRVSNV